MDPPVCPKCYPIAGTASGSFCPCNASPEYWVGGASITPSHIATEHPHLLRMIGKASTTSTKHHKPANWTPLRFNQEPQNETQADPTLFAPAQPPTQPAAPVDQ